MKVTHTVICIKDDTHKLPVVFDVEPDTAFETSRSTELCPFCGTAVEVTIKGKIENEAVIRSLGFDE